MHTQRRTGATRPGARRPHLFMARPPPARVVPVCTLILGVDVIGPESVIAGANRDEDPSRPSDPPAVLLAHPRVVGGRDRRAGGTWLAVREARALVAMLNRRDDGPPPAARRSRGLLALDTAGVRGSGAALAGRALARAALDHTLAGLRAGDYAPFSMVFATPRACWLLAHEPGRPAQVADVSAGWHVLTHTELDDPAEPRAARLLRELEGWRPGSAEAASRGVAERLRQHGDGADASCVHEGRMVTVSSSRVWLAPGEAGYVHIEGRPCVSPEADLTPLLSAAPHAPEQP
jgi:hypothetical protein